MEMDIIIASVMIGLFLLAMVVVGVFPM